MRRVRVSGFVSLGFFKSRVFTPAGGPPTDVTLVPIDPDELEIFLVFSTRTLKKGVRN